MHTCKRNQLKASPQQRNVYRMPPSNREIFEVGDDASEAEVDEIDDFDCCERGWYSEEEDNGSESDDPSCDEFDEESLQTAVSAIDSTSLYWRSIKFRAELSPNFITSSSLSKEFGVTARLHSGAAVPSGSTICNGSNQKRLSVYYSTSSGEPQDLVSDGCQATVKAWRDHFLISKWRNARLIVAFGNSQINETCKRGTSDCLHWLKLSRRVVEMK